MYTLGNCQAEQYVLVTSLQGYQIKQISPVIIVTERPSSAVTEEELLLARFSFYPLPPLSRCGKNKQEGNGPLDLRAIGPIDHFRYLHLFLFTKYSAKLTAPPAPFDVNLAVNKIFQD